MDTPPINIHPHWFIHRQADGTRKLIVTDEEGGRIAITLPRKTWVDTAAHILRAKNQLKRGRKPTRDLIEPL